jgi:uncharacterized membrane protein YgcG
MNYIPIDKAENIILEVEHTKGLNPGMEFRIRSKVIMKNGKEYVTRQEYANDRVLNWNGVKIEVENGTFNSANHTIVVNDGLKYDGVPDTVVIRINAPGSQMLVDIKKVVVDYNSDFEFNVSGQNGSSGYDGPHGSDMQGDSIKGSCGGHGSSGRDGIAGRDVDIYIQDTLVNEDVMLMCHFVTDFKEIRTMFFNDRYLTVKSNGGSGGHGGNGGDGGRRSRYASYKGGNGGNGGHGASGGNITVYISEYVYSDMKHFHFENYAGNGGRAGRSGEGIQNTKGVLGFIVDGVIFNKKEGAAGHSGFTDGKLDIHILENKFK